LLSLYFYGQINDDDDILERNLSSNSTF